MHQYQRYFKSHIWQRGIELYQEGAVYQLKPTQSGYSASVCGNYDDYYVEIDLNEKGIDFMSCTCPYAAQGHNCKHMAAVTLEIEKISQAQVTLTTWQDVFKTYVKDNQILPLQDRAFRNALSAQIHSFKNNEQSLLDILAIIEAILPLKGAQSILLYISGELLTRLHPQTLQANQQKTIQQELQRMIQAHPDSLLLVYLLQFLKDHAMLQLSFIDEVLELLHQHHNETAVNFLLIEKNTQSPLSFQELITYQNYFSVQPLLAQTYLEQKDYAHAIPLYQQLSKNEHCSYAEKNRYFNLLNELYLITKNKTEYRKTLLFALHSRDDEALLTHIDNYKNMFDHEEWQEEYPRIKNAVLPSIPKSMHTKVLLHLGDTTQLLQHLFEHIDIKEIQSNQHFLLENDPENYILLSMACILQTAKQIGYPWASDELSEAFDLLHGLPHEFDYKLDVLQILRQGSYLKNEELQAILDDIESEAIEYVEQI